MPFEASTAWAIAVYFALAALPGHVAVRASGLRSDDVVVRLGLAIGAGLAPLPGTRVRIVTESGDSCAAGEPGAESFGPATEVAGGAWEFHLALYTSKRQWNDLELAESLWKARAASSNRPARKSCSGSATRARSARHVRVGLGGGYFAHCRGMVRIASAEPRNRLYDNALMSVCRGWFRPVTGARPHLDRG